MMNPPDTSKPRKYGLVFDVSEGSSSGQITSFDNLLDSFKTNSLSSGALADHSSLSESSTEQCFGSLPSQRYLEVSSSSSSGHSKIEKSCKTNAQSCQCCRVLNMLKLHCLCNKGAIFFVKDVDSLKESVEVRDPRHLDVACSDMDLTDPVEVGVLETEPISPASDQPEILPFPKISIRLDCVGNFPMIDDDDTESVEVDLDDYETKWSLPKWNHLFLFEDELALHERPPQIPSHYKEDKRSLVYFILWLVQLRYAKFNGLKPPPGIVRVFHDPMYEPAVPQSLASYLKVFNNEDVSGFVKRYQTVRHLLRMWQKEKSVSNVYTSDVARVVDNEESRDSMSPEIVEVNLIEGPLVPVPLAVENVAEEDDTDSSSDDQEQASRSSPPPKKPKYDEPAACSSSSLNEGASSSTQQLQERSSPQHQPSPKHQLSPEHESSSRDLPSPQPSPRHQPSPKPSPQHLQSPQPSPKHQPSPQPQPSPQHQPSPQPSPQHQPSPQPQPSPQRQPSPHPQPSPQRQRSNPVFPCFTSNPHVFSIPYERRFFDSSSGPIEFPDHFYDSDNEVLPMHLPEKSPIFVYAKSDSWYYPALLYATIDRLDSTLELLHVQFFDSSEKVKLSPSKIFPIERLPTGCYVQWEKDVAVYGSVHIVAICAGIRGPFDLPSAVMYGYYPKGTKVAVPFHYTALCPKDAVQVRTILKSNFYPALTRRNFTELVTDAILDPVSKRRLEEYAPLPKRLCKTQKKEVTKKVTPPTERSSSSVTPPLRYDDSIAYVCDADDCKQLFPSKEELEKHWMIIKKKKKRQHREMKTVFLCKIQGCAKYFDTKDLYVNHVKCIHEVGKTFSERPPPIPGPSGCKFPRRPGRTEPKVPTDSEKSDTDASLCFRPLCDSRLNEFGLEEETVVLSTDIKSYRFIKGSKKESCPPLTNVFEGQHFVLTKGTRHFPSQRAPSSSFDYSESDSTDAENYYSTPVKFEVEIIQKAIECGGGRLYASLEEVPSSVFKLPGNYNLILVSDHPSRTGNYIYAVALGLTILRHDPILECAEKGVTLKEVLAKGTATLLPPGWDDIRKMWVPPRASQVKPLNSLLIILALQSQTSWSYWSSLIKLLGGRSVCIEYRHQWSLEMDRSISLIVTDNKCCRQMLMTAAQKGVPVVNTAWLVQATISGAYPNCKGFEVINLEEPAHSP